MDHVAPRWSSYLTPVKDVGAFTAKVSSLAAINNQLRFRHVVKNEYCIYLPVVWEGQSWIVQIISIDTQIKIIKLHI